MILTLTTSNRLYAGLRVPSRLTASVGIRLKAPLFAVLILWTVIDTRQVKSVRHVERSFEPGDLMAEIEAQEQHIERTHQAARGTWVKPPGRERRQPRLSDVPDKRAVSTMSREEKDELLLWLGRGPNFSRALFHLRPGLKVYYGYQAKVYDHTILAVNGDRITTRYKTGEVLEKSIKLYQDWPCYVKNEDL